MSVSRLSRLLVPGRMVILDTCILRSRLGGGYQQLVDFLEEIGAIPAITKVILLEILWGNFPLGEIKHILHMIQEGRLRCVDVGSIEKLVNVTLEDVSFPQMRRRIQRNAGDYLIARAAIDNKALVITDNIPDFWVMKAHGLEFFHSRDLDEIVYGYS